MAISDGDDSMRRAAQRLINAYRLRNDPDRDEELRAALTFAHTFVAKEFGVEAAVACLNWQAQLIIDEAQG